MIFSKIETNGADTGSLRQVVDGYFDALVFQELSDNKEDIFFNKCDVNRKGQIWLLQVS